MTENIEVIKRRRKALEATNLSHYLEYTSASFYLRRHVQTFEKAVLHVSPVNKERTQETVTEVYGALSISEQYRNKNS